MKNKSFLSSRSVVTQHKPTYLNCIQTLITFPRAGAVYRENGVAINCLIFHKKIRRLDQQDSIIKKVIIAFCFWYQHDIDIFQPVGKRKYFVNK